jgi:hypothetical protein
VLLSVATASNAETAEVKIARVITAVPSDITNEATIMDVDGTVLRVEQTGGFVCRVSESFRAISTRCARTPFG